ncbi:MAG: guanylate cyclase, partial [Roseiarcus sp.]
AESLRALRERPSNPDAVDLAMRGRVVWYKFQGVNVNEAIDDFERTLRIDPEQPEALVGLSRALASKVINLSSANPVEDANRADTSASKALSVHPENAAAHLAKAFAIFAGIWVGTNANTIGQWDIVVAETDAAIADDRNLAEAYASAGLWKLFVGRAAEGFIGIETALRLSPHDPTRFSWEFEICALHAYLAQWDQAIEWCRKSLATQPYILSFLTISAAYAWAGRDADAHAAVSELLKLKPGFTVQTWAKVKRSDNPTYLLGLQRIVEGLRKAGLPEE